MIEIKHRFNGQVLCTHNSDNLRWADLRWADLREADLSEADLREADLSGADLSGANLREADLREADLREADLRWADLREADLREADLSWAIGNSKEVKSMLITKYCITYTYDTLAIGCQQHTIRSWLAFSRADIAAMDSVALSWWDEWKPKLAVLGVFGDVEVDNV